MLTPLMYASSKGQVAVARELVSMGADVNAVLLGNGVMGNDVLDSRSPLSVALERSVREFMNKPDCNDCVDGVRQSKCINILNKRSFLQGSGRGWRLNHHLFVDDMVKLCDNCWAKS